METTLDSKSLFLTGAKHSLPIVLGYISVGIAYAVLAKQAGFSDLETFLMSVTCYSGAGQFFAVTMTMQHSSLIALAIGLMILNFRYFIMSTCVFARLKGLDNFRRSIFSHWITDETFAIFTTAKKEYANVPYFLGLFVVSWSGWLSGAILGIVASNFLPENLIQAMNIALYALFIAIIVPACKADFKVFVIVICTAVLNTIFCQFMQECWAILWSIIICSVVGAFFTDNKKLSESQENEKVVDDTVEENK